MVKIKSFDDWISQQNDLQLMFHKFSNSILQACFYDFQNKIFSFHADFWPKTHIF